MKSTTFRQFLFNGSMFIGSFLFFTKDILPLVCNMILGIIAFVLIFLFIVFDVIPTIFSKRIKEKNNEVELVSNRAWLLVLTKNPERLILNLLFVVLAISIFSNRLFGSVPVVLGYVYWMFFGAYFGNKIIRYSRLYQEKYGAKKHKT